MPFSPLPGTFTEDLARLRRTGILELGSGHGAFTELLRDQGCRPWTLDLAGPWRGVRPHVVSDALRPAVRGPFGMVVAANLLRHVWPRVLQSGPRPWCSLVGKDGALWILEDEPLNTPAPANNYRRLQELLARLQPGEHRPLLPLDVFRKATTRWCWSGCWSFGSLDNAWPVAPERVLAMLAAGNPQPGGEVVALMDAIERDGMGYGRAWWARWSPTGAREPEAAT